VRTWLLRGGQCDWTATRDGYPPLHHAVRHGRAELTSLLLKAPGVDVNAEANVGRNYSPTPLALACVRNSPLIATLLLEHGADPQRRDGCGSLPLDLAIYSGHTPVADVLLRHSRTQRKQQSAANGAGAAGEEEDDGEAQLSASVLLSATFADDAVCGREWRSSATRSAAAALEKCDRAARAAAPTPASPAHASRSPTCTLSPTSTVSWASPLVSPPPSPMSPTAPNRSLLLSSRRHFARAVTRKSRGSGESARAGRATQATRDDSETSSDEE
jgi:hypothetical protein